MTLFKWLSKRLWAILLLGCMQAQAVQHTDTSATSLVDSPLLRPLTTEDGLTSGSVNRLHIDTKGFLWIGTDKGINFFDGYRLRSVALDPSLPTGLAISQIYEDPQRRFWLAAQQKGLYLLNRQTAEADLVLPLDQLELAALPRLWDVTAQDENHLLLAVDTHVYRFNLHSRALEKLFSMPATNHRMSRIRVLHKRGDLLLIGSTTGLYVYNIAKQQSYQVRLQNVSNEPLASTVRSIYPLKDALLVAMGDALYRLTPLDLQLAAEQILATDPVLQHIQVERVAPTDKGYLLASRDGLYKTDLQFASRKLLWRFTQSAYDIDQDLIRDIVASDDGGFWLASRQQGAYYWHPQSTHFHHLKLPIPTNSELPLRGPAMFSPRAVLALAEYAPNQLLLATPAGLHQFDPASRQLTTLTYPSPLPDGFSAIVARLYPESGDKLYIRSGLGLFLYQLKQQSFLPLPLDNPAQQALLQQNAASHWRDAQGRFWFTSPESYYRYDPATSHVQEFAELKNAEPPYRAGRFLGQLPQSPSTVLFSAADRLWAFNTDSGKLTKLFEATPYQPGLQRLADKLCITNDGHLWFSIDQLGLVSLDGKQLTLRQHLYAGHGLTSNSAYSCETDQQGQLWFASLSALHRLNPTTLKVQSFDRRDGLSGSEFSFSAVQKLQDGQLVYGSNAGLTWFNPADIHMSDDKPHIVISGIGAMNQASNPALTDLSGQRFEFAHDSLGIEVRFSSLNFRNGDEIQYKFWLEGSREIRFPIQTAGSVTFPQLAPGKYQFFVKAVSPQSGLESDIASIQLNIMAPPWLSPLALGSYAVLLLLLGLLWQHNRRAHKRLLAHAHYKVLASEQRLKLALEAVNSGVWDYMVAPDSMYAQRIHQMLGYSEELNPLSLQQHRKLIHPEDRDSYDLAWQRFIKNSDANFDHTYRMQHKNGDWLWFRDIGKITEVIGQQPSRVIGTYSNVTETRASKEKARLFGEAFQQTRDWVVLLDPAQRVLAANQSFTDVFGNMDDYMNNPRVHNLGISIDRRRFYTRLLSGMQANQHWQGEELVTSPDGIERPTLINISAVGEALVEFYVLVFTDITAQKQAEEDLRYLANYDALTGLPNRTLLMDRILHGIESAKREKRSLALCFIDLDKFKQINDSLGHDIGDLLLKQVARRLTATLRLTDTVARLGGDEFVVLLESYKNDDNISHVARKMLKAIAEPMQLNNHLVSVSPSIGIAVYPEDAADATELLKHADVAMYHAKDLGRNNFQFFIQEMNDKAHMQLARETRIRTAWQQKQFLNYYQPIYDSQAHKVVGLEVLMRWQESDTMVPPSDFIPLAEDLRLIIPMTQALLQRALADLRQWHLAGFPIYLSVNLSPSHLEQENLALEIAALLAQYEIPAQSLRFEVTESALMQDHQSAIASMLALSELGVQIALDDFGTGYSSLKYLKELPIDGIKIDRSFVKDIGIDRNDETIIDAMLSMASSLGMYCIAEGVETEQQLAFFSQRGCHMIQGYLFGKPMPTHDVQLMLQQQNL